MAALKLQRLKEIITSAYDAGFNGCLDLRDEYVDEIMQTIASETKARPKTENGAEWHIFTMDELKAKPVGTIFEHSSLGQCWIDSGVDNKKQMTFANGDTSYFVQNNVAPWDELMRETGKKVG